MAHEILKYSLVSLLPNILLDGRLEVEVWFCKKYCLIKLYIYLHSLFLEILLKLGHNELHLKLT